MDGLDILMCRCNNAPAEDEQVCPYDEDVNNDPTSMCNCCDDCRRECANDI